ncbi:hypothetical protein [Mycobacterium uberis]|uniref:hypothetical protein n=1 Tax=Mycobacterium uberis TaxID=2162698 RepID=UPI0014020C67|nr:hypothetical protein [Mycobacterium uberis]
MINPSHATPQRGKPTLGVPGSGLTADGHATHGRRIPVTLTRLSEMGTAPSESAAPTCVFTAPPSAPLTRSQRADPWWRSNVDRNRVDRLVARRVGAASSDKPGVNVTWKLPDMQSGAVNTRSPSVECTTEPA